MILKNIKSKQDEGSAEGEGRITFDDYERLMQKIEQDERYELIEQENPRARAYAEESKRKRVLDELDYLASKHIK